MQHLTTVECKYVHHPKNDRLRPLGPQIGHCVQECHGSAPDHRIDLTNLGKEGNLCREHGGGGQLVYAGAGNHQAVEIPGIQSEIKLGGTKCGCGCGCG